MNNEALVTRAEFNRHVRRTAIITTALAAGLVFGIILLANGDWIPGAIIVAATVVGLAVEIPVIRKLCSMNPPLSPPDSKPAIEERKLRHKERSWNRS